MTTSPALRRRRAARRLAALLVVALSSAACTQDAAAPPPAPRTSTVTTGAVASQSRAAELQAGLTYVLVERVYVTAAATSAVLASGGRVDQPEVAAALEALEVSSTSLAGVLEASVEARPPLLLALRTSDRAHVEHAVARSDADAAEVATARAGLDRAQRELSAVLRRVVPGLDAEEVTARLLADLAAQLAADGDEPYPALRAAAVRARDTARVLADGVAEDRQLGPSGTRAATLRSDLTALLTEHQLLAGGLAHELAVASGDGAGGDGGGARSARTALDANTLALSELFGRAYPAVRAPFLRLWTGHVALLGEYAAAVASGESSSADGLHSTPGTMSRLLAAHIDQLPVDRVAAELATTLDAQLVAVDAAASGSRQAPTELRRAAAAAPAPAALLAAAIAEHLGYS
ncbi:MAG: hypothetical protein ACR2K2_08840 [Mycobacteriales bacterium]